MKAKSTYIFLSSIFLLIQNSGHAYADVPPQTCYDGMSDSEYQRFVKIYKEALEDPTEVVYHVNRDTFTSVAQKLKKVHIDLKITQEKPGDLIKLDASGSDTPSKEKRYNWTVSGKNTFQHNDDKKAQNTLAPFGSGVYKELQFGITDPVCGSSNAATFKIHSK